MSDQDQFYDYDRDIANRSPGLQKVIPTYDPHDSPEPLIPRPSSSDSSDVEDLDVLPATRKPRKRKGRTNPSFADGVLIRSLDPNQVALAHHAERNALESASQSEAEEEYNEPEGQGEGQPAHRQMSRSDDVIQSRQAQVPAKSKDIAAAALNAIPHDRDKDDDWPMIDTPAEDRLPPSPASTTSKTNDSRHQEEVEVSVLSKKEDAPRKQLNTLPPPLNGGLRLNLKPSEEFQDDEEDSIIKSPALAKFAIARNDAPPDSILPALQPKSPPRSSPAGSPDQRQTLPNIKTAIGHIKDSSFAYAMSPMSRPSPVHLGPYAASPASYSAMSPPPPGPPSQYNWRTNARDSKTSSSSNYTSSSSGTVSTPASSIHIPSPAASHPSTLASVPEQNGDGLRRDSMSDADSRSESELLADPLADDPNSSRFVAGSYKCTYHSCTAIPFQTQYLLNSHMNVHSNHRTHFCPVDGCTRGPGGQGFKRKNEMIRSVENARNISHVANIYP